MEPTQGCQKCDRAHIGGGTGTLDKLAGSHTRLAIYPHPCNLLPKGCDLCFARYQVQGEEVVIYPVAIKQMKSQ